MSILTQNKIDACMKRHKEKELEESVQKIKEL